MEFYKNLILSSILIYLSYSCSYLNVLMSKIYKVYFFRSFLSFIKIKVICTSFYCFNYLILNPNIYFIKNDSELQAVLRDNKPFSSNIFFEGKFIYRVNQIFASQLQCLILGLNCGTKSISLKRNQVNYHLNNGNF